MSSKIAIEINMIFILALACLIFLDLNGTNDTSFELLLARVASLPKINPPRGVAGISLDELIITLDSAKKSFNHQLKNSGQWLNNQDPFDSKHDSNSSIFCQKIIVPQESTIAFLGDLHGNIQGFVKIIGDLQVKNILDDQLHLTRDDYYLFFLGDYVDRGDYGAEILYLLALLKLHNPDQVFCTRGNHEDANLNQYYGFNEELRSKYPAITDREIASIQELYNYLPAALYLGIQTTSGIDYIQCCHGGLEIGYNPQSLLASEKQFERITHLHRSEYLTMLPAAVSYPILRTVPSHELGMFCIQNLCKPVTIGFMWHDFMENNTYANPTIDFTPGRGWIYGKKLTQAILQQQSTDLYRIKAIFRAHQHHGHMLNMLEHNRGMVSLWNGLVYTFLPLPLARTSYDHSSYGLLSIGENYEKSSLEHIVLA